MAERGSEQEAQREKDRVLMGLSLLTLITFLGCGAGMGFVLAGLFAESSDGALLLGVIILPTCYFLSFLVCREFLSLGWLSRLLRDREVEFDASNIDERTASYRRRALMAVPVSTVVSALGGYVIGTLGSASALVAASGFALLGVLFGALFYSFAQFDVLPLMK